MPHNVAYFLRFTTPVFYHWFHWNTLSLILACKVTKYSPKSIDMYAIDFIVVLFIEVSSQNTSVVYVSCHHLRNVGIPIIERETYTYSAILFRALPCAQARAEEWVSLHFPPLLCQSVRQPLQRARGSSLSVMPQCFCLIGEPFK